jgi:hypothetical protein
VYGHFRKNLIVNNFQLPVSLAVYRFEQRDERARVQVPASEIFVPGRQDIR